MSDSPRYLLQNETSDDTGPAVAWEGGEGTLRVWGSFGGGTFTLQASFDAGASYIEVENAVLTGPAIRNFRLPVCRLRAVLSGASGADVTAQV